MVTLSFLFPNHLTPQVTRHIRDVNPSSISLPDELGETYLPRLQHLLYELEQLAVVGPVACDNIGGTAEEMVAILGASHQGVELFAAIAAAHHDRLAPRFAYRVEELVY